MRTAIRHRPPPDHDAAGDVPAAVPTGSLTRFAEQHSVGLTRFAMVLCGDRGRAEDLVQEAYLALHRRFGDELDIEAPVAYARRIIVNAHVSSGRRRAGNERTLESVPDTADPDDPAGRHDAQDAMWRVLATLPHRQRTVMVLRYYLDLPDREIADLLSCRESSVRSLAARAFATLRSHPDLVPGDRHE